MPRPFPALFGATAALLSAAPALAQPAAETPDAPAPAAAETQGDRTLYPAAWFQRYAPATALDMASRVPGFTVENGDDEVRGFAGAVGNVVINGARPSAKAETLEDILRRIPAAQVVRLEVLPGAVVGAEYRSRSQVLNVVLSETGRGVSGSAEVTLQHVYTGHTTPEVSLSLLRRAGDLSLGVAASYEDDPAPDEGWDELRLASGALVERRDKKNLYREKQASLSGNLGWEPGEGRSAHLNGRVWTWENPLTHSSRVTGPAGPLRNDTIDQAPSREGFEVGGDAAHSLAGGVLKFVGLVRRERFELLDESRSRTPAGAPIGGVGQQVDNLFGETVGRLVWSHERLFGWSLETGGELAFNTLDGDVDLYRLDPADVRTPIPLPVSDVLVEELRGEAFVTAGRRRTPDLTFDLGAAVETSTLTVSGDAEAERSLTFLKPRASIEWTPGDVWRLRASAERTVAQLDFNDFVSSAEFANDRVNSGNPDVEPERTWRLLALVERKVLGEGQLRLSLYYDRVQMVQDRVPTPDGFDAPGNLGDGRRLWLEAVADLPLDRLQVPGGRFNLRWVRQDSDVQDPYTLSGRDFSGEQAWSLTASFRQDVKAWNLAWGVDYLGEGGLPQYRRNEIDIWNPENNNVGAFIEYRPAANTTLTLNARNLLDRDIVRNRTFYDPDRRTPAPFAFEERRRWQRITTMLTLKRTFG